LSGSLREPSVRSIQLSYGQPDNYPRSQHRVLRPRANLVSRGLLPERGLSGGAPAALAEERQSPCADGEERRPGPSWNRSGRRVPAEGDARGRTSGAGPLRRCASRARGLVAERLRRRRGAAARPFL